MFVLYFTLLASLFSVVNPIGAMPIFLSMTAQDSAEERNRIARNASVYLCIILIVSFIIGTYILTFFGISIDALRIAGGIIIMLSGFDLLRGNHARGRNIDKKVKTEAVKKDDISLTPLAIPLLAGPGSISLLIGMFKDFLDFEHYIIVHLVIITTGILTFIILRFSTKLVSKLGEAGMSSLSRIIGFIVMTVGVQFIINGVSSIVRGF
ncbi:MAG: MarC family NAAT transporter [Chitinophagales bacterium]